MKYIIAAIAGVLIWTLLVVAKNEFDDSVGIYP